MGIQEKKNKEEMKLMNIRKTGKSYNALVLMLLMMVSFSCDQWDDFRKYSAGGEIVYPGKITSLDINSGENRVQLTGTLGPDPRVSTLRIFWNDFTDSLVLQASEEIRAAGFDQIVEVSEGLRTFVVYTYDDDGNRSLPVSELGIAFGEAYRAKVQNRTVSSIHPTDSSTMIIWRPIDTSTGAHHVEVDYSVDGNALTAATQASKDTTELVGLIGGGEISFYTVYLPSAECIDLFYSDTIRYTID